MNQCFIGDCRESMRLMLALDMRVQMCVTSPPYYGLRDYGHAGQLGLEETPDEYVANMVEVFRLVRDLLADDGTLWLNLGDSYATAGGSGKQGKSGQRSDRRHTAEIAANKGVGNGIKPKDLIGIPWRVAFALQQPYYTGRIKDERDRIWLAAMLDAEGCMFIHKRKTGQHNGQGYYRKNDNYGPGVEISNTSLAVVEKIAKITGQGSICSQGPEENGRRKQRIYRWNLRTVECREFVRELYPYLIAKQQQARILIGCPSSGEQAEAAHAALIQLHRSGSSDVDFPIPKTMSEPGFYLRQDVIWGKSNPMPESVTDRCTKAHEYLFLLSKSPRYYFDNEAIKEPAIKAGKVVHSYGTGAKDRQDVSDINDRRTRIGLSNWNKPVPETRNRRSVWTIATKPYKGAHFATFPPDLIEPCILAGSRPGDTVLDPFFGSGTTGEVAQKHDRKWLGCEINSEYKALQDERIK